MSTQGKKKRAVRAGPPPVLVDEDPLLRVLIAKAATQGKPLNALAKELGVTYSRLAQWRRARAAMKSVNRSVHVRAASYLGIPTVLALAMAGVVRLEDFVLPAPESLDERLGKDIEEMRHDPFFAPFVPQSLNVATPELRLFIVFLYRQARGTPSAPPRGQPWLTELHQAALTLQEFKSGGSRTAGP